jgi:hypothetical protein
MSYLVLDTDVMSGIIKQDPVIVQVYASPFDKPVVGRG